MARVWFAEVQGIRANVCDFLFEINKNSGACSLYNSYVKILFILSGTCITCTKTLTLEIY